MPKSAKLALAGICAGIVNGLFGAGGGMVLVPLLQKAGVNEESIFQTSVSIMLPLCVVSLCFYASQTTIPFSDALPYMLGGALGGIAAALTGRNIPTKWLHRVLGALIIWGGIRYLC